MGEPLKIGELLVRAGVITEDKLNERLGLARQLGLPVGHALIESQDVDQEQLVNFIHIQSLNVDGLITLETAVHLTRNIFKNHITLEEGLAQEGLADQHLSHRLGELLVMAGYISEENLAWALLASGDNGIPLGHVLIQTGAVPPAIVAIALTTQHQLRMKSMTTDEAVARLRNFKPSAATA